MRAAIWIILTAWTRGIGSEGVNGRDHSDNDQTQEELTSVGRWFILGST